MQQFTKKEIRLSMFRLLKSTPLDKIKVRHIATDCGISRNTFYYHYQDIYDVLEDLFRSTMKEIVESCPDDEFDWEYVFSGVAENALMNRRILANISSSKYFDQILSHLTDIIGDFIATRIREEDTEKKYSEENIIILSTFLKHAITGTFMEWVRNGMKTDTEEIITKMGQIFPKNLDNIMDMM